jgi:glycine/D-amino acid oxidase-like deaminating enzyme/nitrite reductase/ring-hydroxylating ferredoxin subunit
MGQAGQKRAAIWSTASDDLVFAPLDRDLEVEVVVVGGGITGITMAAVLGRAGRRVAVLESGRVGFGSTGSSTGNLYATVGQSLHQLVAKWGTDTVAQVVNSRNSAIDLIQKQVQDYGLDCGFARQPWVMYSLHASRENERTLTSECEAARACGLRARLTGDLPLPYPVHQALLIPDQAQFHPLKYVRQLAAAIRSERCAIHEGSPVVEIDGENGIVKTPGFTIRAEHVVMATHTPKGLSALHTELGPYREYAVAAPLGERQLPGGIFWSTGPESHSIRRVEIEGRGHVMVIGEKHKTGQRDDAETAYHRLEEVLRVRFNVTRASHTWSAQQYRAADYLPYIGPSPGSARVHLACGFGADGLVYGTLAAMLIGDHIAGRDNPLLQLFSPRRFTPLRSARQFVKENLNVAGYFVKDYFKGADAQDAAQVARGEGRIIEVGADKMAVFRDDNDRLHAVSALCTHMKCVVHWNRAERSWDCPCHGSRFSIDGDVLEGPAITPLERRAPHIP